MEGFCWNNVLNPKARLLKVKLKQASVNDVGSMSLISASTMISSQYIIGVLNSNLLFDYYREFINCTVNVQINDLRQMPIYIPNTKQAETISLLVDKVINYKKSASNQSKTDVVDEEITIIEQAIDDCVNKLYHI